MEIINPPCWTGKCSYFGWGISCHCCLQLTTTGTLHSLVSSRAKTRWLYTQSVTSCKKSFIFQSCSHTCFFFPVHLFIHSLSLFLNIYICPYMYIYIVLYRSPPCYWITVPGKSHVGATNRLYKIWSFTYYLYTCYMSSLDLPKWLVHRSEPVFFCSFTSLLIFASLLICFSIYR